MGVYRFARPDSTTYTGAVGRRGVRGRFSGSLETGLEVVPKSRCDRRRAEWLWTLVAEHFPQATPNWSSLYRAVGSRQTDGWELARRLYPNDEGKQRLDESPPESTCWVGRIERLVALSALSLPHPKQRQAPPRGRLLCQECGAHALPNSAASTSSGFGSHEADAKRGRFPPQTLWNVLDRASQRISPPSSLLNGRFKDDWEGRRAAFHLHIKNSTGFHPMP